MNPTPTPGGRALLAAWLICGVLDINAAFTSAYLVAGRSPLWVLRAVASAVLGKASFDYGAWAPALGLGMHFFVAFNAAAVFWLLSRKFPACCAMPSRPDALWPGRLPVHELRHDSVLLLVPQPLPGYAAELGARSFAWPQFGIHLTCVGLSISLAVRRWSR